MVRKNLPRILLLSLLIICLFCVWHFRELLNVEKIEALFARTGPWAAVVYVLAYAVSSLAFIPVTIMTITGGALFGPAQGTLLALSGAGLGAAIGFTASRHYFSDWVHAKGWHWLNMILAGVEKEGWKFVALVRLVPLVPFSASNYAFGLARIPLLHFIPASLICMSPATLAYCWLGHSGRQSLSGESNLIQLGLVALALLAIIVLLPGIIRRFKATELDSGA